MSRSSNLPVLVGPAQGPRREHVSSGRRTGRAGAFEAQLLGQDGARRGLKGGPAVLEAARAAYLETEWLGPADRRLPSGLLVKSKV